MRFAVQGAGLLTEDTLLLAFNRLQWAYRDLAWNADGGALLRVTGNGMKVSGLVLRRGDAVVSFDGRVRTGGALEAR